MTLKCWWSLPCWHNMKSLAAPLMIIITDDMFRLTSFLDESHKTCHLDLNKNKNVPQFFILNKQGGVKLLERGVKETAHYSSQIIFFIEEHRAGLQLNYLAMAVSIWPIYFMVT